MKRYVEAIRVEVLCLRLCVLQIASVFLLNLLFRDTSQGVELTLAAHRAAGSSPLSIAVAYFSCCTWVSVVLVLRYSRYARSAPVPPENQFNPICLWPIPCALILISIVPALNIINFPVPSVSLMMGGLIALCFAVPAIPRKNMVSLGRTLLAPRSGLSIVWMAIAAVTLGLIILVITIARPVSFPRFIGAWALVYWALGFWTMVGTLLFALLPNRLGLPSLLVVPLVLALLFSRYNDNHAVRLLQADKPQIPIPVADDSQQSKEEASKSYYAFALSVVNWLASHCQVQSTETSEPCPVIFVAAEGGGIRAAYWTASVLSELDRQSNGRFWNHLFALSGVSGGSLGATSYVLSRAKAKSSEEVAQPLRQFLSRDYLSPLLAGLLTGDLIQRFLPTPVPQLDRARAFEYSLEDSWSQAFKNNELATGFLQFFASQANRYALPSLFLNSTNVETGKRYIISNLLLPLDHRNDEYFAFDNLRLPRFSDMRTSTAISVSSRFPIIAPHALLLSSPSSLARSTWPFERNDQPPSEVMWGRLVDGGYYENSGAATLFDVARAFTEVVNDLHTGIPADEWHGALQLGSYIRPQITVVLISNDPRPLQYSTGTNEAPRPPLRPAEPPEEVTLRYVPRFARNRVFGETDIWNRSAWLSELLSPPEALWDTRDARATGEKVTLVRYLKTLQEEDALRCADKVYKAPQGTVAAGQQLEWLMLQHKLALLGVTKKEEERRQCTPLLAYEEFSLAKLLNDDERPSGGPSTDQEYKEELQDLAGPGLGWSLSERSQRRMDKLAQKAPNSTYLYGWVWGSLTYLSLDRYYHQNEQPPK